MAGRDSSGLNNALPFTAPCCRGVFRDSMAAAMQDRVLKEILKSYSYVLLWMSISISVILFNKWLLAFSGFPYPITLTMWHMLFCSTVGFLCVRVGRFVKPHNMSAHDYLRRVMPIGGLYISHASSIYEHQLKNFMP